MSFGINYSEILLFVMCTAGFHVTLLNDFNFNKFSMENCLYINFDFRKLPMELYMFTSN